MVKWSDNGRTFGNDSQVSLQGWRVLQTTPPPRQDELADHGMLIVHNLCVHLHATVFYHLQSLFPDENAKQLVFEFSPANKNVSIINLRCKEDNRSVFCPLSYEKMGKNSGLRFYNLSSLICWLIYKTVRTRLVALLIEKLHFTWLRFSRRKAAAPLTTFSNFDFNPSRNLQISKRFREASKKQHKFLTLGKRRTHGTRKKLQVERTTKKRFVEKFDGENTF